MKYTWNDTWINEKHNQCEKNSDSKNIPPSCCSWDIQKKKIGNGMKKSWTNLQEFFPRFLFQTAKSLSWTGPSWPRCPRISDVFTKLSSPNFSGFEGCLILGPSLVNPASILLKTHSHTFSSHHVWWFWSYSKHLFKVQQSNSWCKITFFSWNFVRL